MKYYKLANMFGVALILITYAVRYVSASDLPVNHNEFIDFQKACPECIGIDVMVCGNSKIGSGNRFLDNFFQGQPSRGFLISPPYLSADMRNLIRTEVDLTNLVNTIRNQFLKLNLIAVSNSFKVVHRLCDPIVEVMIPEPLHQCLSDPANKWGCGISKQKDRECCEKNLGSPIVKTTWVDSSNNERLELFYIPTLGATKLIRQMRNKTKVIYYCQTFESAKMIDNGPTLK